MTYDSLTPTETMILMALQIHPEQTIDALMAVTGTATRKYMLRTLRVLIMCGRIERIADLETPTYRLVA